MNNKIKVDYNGKEIETDRLYRYKLDIKTGKVDLLVKEIEGYTTSKYIFDEGCPVRIKFGRGDTLSYAKIGRVFNSTIVYLPIPDKDRAIELFKENYDENINIYESKLNYLKDVFSKIEANN